MSVHLADAGQLDKFLPLLTILGLWFFWDGSLLDWGVALRVGGPVLMVATFNLFQFQGRLSASAIASLGCAPFLMVAAGFLWNNIPPDAWFFVKLIAFVVALLWIRQRWFHPVYRLRQKLHANTLWVGDLARWMDRPWEESMGEESTSFEEGELESLRVCPRLWMETLHYALADKDARP